MGKNEKLFETAKTLIPGGVNSPVRAFRAVGGNPPFIQSAKGAHITDCEGRTYLDFVGSWGPMILGHADERILAAVSEAIKDGLSFGAPTEREVLVAQKMKELVPELEMVRMVNSGTEAVMSAIRLARGYTGRNKIIKFAGCYHGHSDSMLVKAGSGAMTAGVPDSAGVPEAVAADTLTAGYNHLAQVKQLFIQNSKEIAAVIVEPVAANMGVVPPELGFLQGLRKLCDEQGAVLIFDEVITGFRLAKGGAQERYGVQADLCTYGKIIGGGMPVGAYGGKREIMEHVAPLGAVYQAGTLSGNPVAMAAGLAQLSLLDAELYQKIEKLSEMLEQGFASLIQKYKVPATVTRVGSLICLFFTEKQVKNYEDAKTSDTTRYSRYFQGMLEEGIYLAPSQFEAMFVSGAHTEEDIWTTLTAAEKVLRKLA